MDKEKQLKINVYTLNDIGFSLSEISIATSVPEEVIKNILSEIETSDRICTKNSEMIAFIRRVWPQVNKWAQSFEKLKSKGRRKAKRRTRVIPATEIPRGYIW